MTYTPKAVVWACLLALGATTALAQDAQSTVNHFRASETVEDGFAISRPEDQGHMRFGAQLHLDYANDPLVVENRLGDRASERVSVVEHQLTGTLGLSLGLADRLVIYAGLPVNFVMSGADQGADAGQVPVGIPVAEGFALGDAYLGARLRILGEYDDIIGLGLQVTGTFPTNTGNYAGESFLTVHPELLLAVRPGSLRFTLNVGARFTEENVFAGNVTTGNALTFGLGLTAPLFGDYRNTNEIRVDLHAQIWGQSSFADFFGREETPLEALGGFKIHTVSGFTIGLAGGAGIRRGFGSPDGRAILQLGFATPRETVAEEVASSDRDEDGIADEDDSCPDEAEDADDFNDDDGCPDLDNDEDGIADSDDQCPNDAETMNGNADEDGCPDEAVDGDQDGDGVPDSADQCADQAEDRDEFQDEDGCPDLDNDEDGIADTDDQCPLEAEDRDGFEDENGCPEADNDQDTLNDPVDNCPNEAGPVDNGGCPEAQRQRVRITANNIEILEKVYFRTDSDQIQRRSHALLDNVVAVLNNHPEITHLRIEGHTDDRGDDDHNMDLSTRRAEAVKAYLASHGVDEGRLHAQGFGETRPVVENDTREHRAQNRRVEFNIGAAAAAE